MYGAEATDTLEQRQFMQNFAHQHRQRARGTAARALFSELDMRSARLSWLISSPPDSWRVRMRNRIQHGMAATRHAWQSNRTAGEAVNLPVRIALHFVVVALLLVIVVGEYGFAWSRHAAAPLPAAATYTARNVPADPQHNADVLWSRPFALPTMRNTGFSRQPETSAVPLAPAQQPLQVVLTPAFREAPHVLTEGETLGSVAAHYGVSLEALVWSNHLHQGDVLAIGQALRIPQVSGVPYVIQAGETLDDIAARFSVPAEIIAAFTANGIGLDQPLPVGQEIFVPSGQAPLPEQLLIRHGSREGVAASAAQPAGIVQAAQSNMREGPDTVYVRVAQFDADRRAALLARHDDWLKVDIGGQVGWMHTDLLAAPADMVAALPETSDFPPPPPIWVWPTYGTFTSPFGPRWGGFHNGIDIANSAWTPIVAARAGYVVESGWCSGYGYCVRINHPGGMQTIYGHLVDHPVVSVGDSVAAGELIGHMGSTYDAAGGGYSTGNHLHFTLTINGRAVNPLNFLP